MTLVPVGLEGELEAEPAMRKVCCYSESVHVIVTQVGGTTMGTLLTSYAFNTNQVLSQPDAWCQGQPIYPSSRIDCQPVLCILSNSSKYSYSTCVGPQTGFQIFSDAAQSLELCSPACCHGLSVWELSVHMFMIQIDPFQALIFVPVTQSKVAA